MSVNLREEFDKACLCSLRAGMIAAGSSVGGLYIASSHLIAPPDSLINLFAGGTMIVAGAFISLKFAAKSYATREAACKAVEEERRNPPDMFKLPEGRPPKQPR